jgi:hypothetical protein
MEESFINGMSQLQLCETINDEIITVSNPAKSGDGSHMEYTVRVSFPIVKFSAMLKNGL